MKRRYRRYFVMLEEEDKGFSNSKSEATKGYGRIEIRNDHGTLSLYCQNLKKLEEKKERYRLYLIHTKDSLEPTVVDIGPIKVDNNGKGEIVWEFNAENVKGFKKSIEDFDVLALVVETLEEPQRLLAPLAGYIHKEKSNWKPMLQRKLLVATKAQEENIVAERKISLEPKEKPPKKEILDQEEKIDKIEEEIKQEKVKLIPKPKEDSVEKNLDKKPQEESISPHNLHKDLAINENNYASIKHETEVHPLQKYVESTLKTFPKVKPFDTNLINYEWWQIHYDTQTIYRAYMPFISHIEVMINPYYYHYPYYSSSEYQRQLYRYRHYIFGICYDERKKAKYYVYGIPGKRSKIEQPYTGKTGFVHWHACHYEQFKQEDLGYWLMHINAETGKVEEPLVATEI